ncbi:MAG: ABC transporter substrate-binding protein [Syntrophomonadaceae bacterium]
MLIRRQTSIKRLRAMFIPLLLIISLLATGCSGGGNTAKQGQLVLADVSWDSVKVHNRIVGFILEHGYGYPAPAYTFGESLPLLQGMSKGDIDITMEVWVDNYKEAWTGMVNDGSVKDLGSNFPDAPQGWYVPTYMIKGDAARGIQAVAPDLKSVTDLPRYWELFKSPEVPGKGRFHNSAPGWVCTEINETKIKNYGLDKTFQVFSTGSDAALSASMVAAYEKGQPWVGYYWEPTWVMGQLDMTLLAEPAYDQAIWDDPGNRGCAYPAAKVQKGVNSSLVARAPEVIDFLSKYQTNLAQNNDFLAYMNQNQGDPEKAALYFLQKYPDTWKAWLPSDVAAKVEQALKEVK